PERGPPGLRAGAGPHHEPRRGGLLEAARPRTFLTEAAVSPILVRRTGMRPEAAWPARGRVEENDMPTKGKRGVPPVPEGHRSLAPYLYVRGASRAMDFYARAFGARELFHMPTPDGRIAHAEMQIGDSVLMLADESPEQGSKSPEGYGGTPAGVFLYVPEV